MFMIFNTIEHSLIIQEASSAIAMLGPVEWPLLLCSMLAFALILDRLIGLLRARTYLSSRQLHAGLRTFQDSKASPDSLALWGKSNSMTRQLAELLHAHRAIPREHREDLASVWIDKHERRLGTGLNILALISVVSPLLGLLGTVLGLMEMFSKIASVHQAINPSMLAHGLGMALMTTIVGLFIAIPALVGFHTLKLWRNHKISFIVMLANQINLCIDGIGLSANTVNSNTNTKQNSESHPHVELAYSAAAGERHD